MEVLDLSTEGNGSLGSWKDDDSRMDHDSDVFPSELANSPSQLSRATSSSASVTVVDEFLSEIAPSVDQEISPVTPKRVLQTKRKRRRVTNFLHGVSSTNSQSLVESVLTASEVDSMTECFWDDTAWHLPKKRRSRSEGIGDEPISVRNPNDNSTILSFEILDITYPLCRLDPECITALNIRNRVSIPRVGSNQWHIWNRLRGRSSAMRNHLSSPVKPSTSPHRLYRWLRVRLVAGLVRSSLAFLHETIERKYQEATILLRGLQTDTNHQDKYLLPLIELRDGLADFWCVYAHFTIDLGLVALDKIKTRPNEPTPKATIIHGNTSCCSNVHNEFDNNPRVDGSTINNSSKHIKFGDSVDPLVRMTANFRREEARAVDDNFVTIDPDKGQDIVISFQPPLTANGSCQNCEYFHDEYYCHDVVTEQIVSKVWPGPSPAMLPQIDRVDRNERVEILNCSTEEGNVHVLVSPKKIVGASQCNCVSGLTNNTTSSVSAWRSSQPEEYSVQSNDGETDSFMVVLTDSVAALLKELGIREPKEFLERPTKSLCEGLVTVRKKKGLPPLRDVLSVGATIRDNKARVKTWLQAKERVTNSLDQSKTHSCTRRKIEEAKRDQRSRMQAENLDSVQEQLDCHEKYNKGLVPREIFVRDVAERAISILAAARACPLVGNHTLIVLNFGRLIVSSSAMEKANGSLVPIALSKCDLLSKIKTAIRSYRDVIDMCHGTSACGYHSIQSPIATQNTMEFLAEFEFRGRKLGTERRISKHALQFGMKSVLNLPQTLRDSAQHEHAVFNDTNTIPVLCGEINKLSRLEEVLETNSGHKLKLRTSLGASSSLVTDDLPLFGPIECLMDPLDQIPLDHGSERNTTINWEWG
jgi:hypothetical protein